MPIMGVNTYTGYVVNGFKFQTEEYCRRKSTSNYGVSIKGTGLAHFESNFFGTLQEVVEVEYPNVPIKKVVLFNCEWFDPTPNIGSIFNSEYGIAEVHCNKRYRKYDPFTIAQSACQVCYIPYPQGIQEKMNWWVVLNVRPRGAIDIAYSSSYTYQQDNIPLHTYGGDQSIQDDMQELVHEPLQMNEVELSQSGNHRTDQGVETKIQKKMIVKKLKKMTMMIMYKVIVKRLMMKMIMRNPKMMRQRMTHQWQQPTGAIIFFSNPPAPSSFRQKDKRLISQPPIQSNSETNQPPSPANDVQKSNPSSNTFPQSSQNSDSERTISASPSNVPSPPTSPSNSPTVRPIGNKSFEPWRANRDVIECVTKIFPDAMKSYKDAHI
nr:uncharacterized protein LOC109190339 [Ipomoea trifida]